MKALTKLIPALAVFVCTLGAAHAQDSAATRYGIVYTAEDHQLYYDGELVFPNIRGNNSLSILASVPLADLDVVVVRDNGGSFCPAKYYLIAVNAAGLKVVGPFGKCSDYMRITPAWDKLVVETPNEDGLTVVYVYRPDEDFLGEEVTWDTSRWR